MGALWASGPQENLLNFGASLTPVQEVTKSSSKALKAPVETSSVPSTGVYKPSPQHTLTLQAEAEKSGAVYGPEAAHLVRFLSLLPFPSSCLEKICSLREKKKNRERGEALK